LASSCSCRGTGSPWRAAEADGPVQQTQPLLSSKISSFVSMTRASSIPTYIQAIGHPCTAQAEEDNNVLAKDGRYCQLPPTALTARFNMCLWVSSLLIRQPLRMGALKALLGAVRGAAVSDPTSPNSFSMTAIFLP
jgi:hypothetical protein